MRPTQRGMRIVDIIQIPGNERRSNEPGATRCIRQFSLVIIIAAKPKLLTPFYVLA